ncbi:DNA-directed RNA polymerase I core subunit rpa12 [Irineochytrium annulatum]|nr:DNA-directed RNA polymerase I core subunit rpa12 [Irineochytrium annulatum]
MPAKMKTMQQKSQAHSMVFCKMCGSLLEPPVDDETHVSCKVCEIPTVAAHFDSLEVVTTSRPGAFAKRPKLTDKKETVKEKGATIQEKCPKCGNPEMEFHTAQLRSADEGQTVFYTCVKCGFKDKLNS